MLSVIYSAILLSLTAPDCNKNENKYFKNLSSISEISSTPSVYNASTYNRIPLLILKKSKNSNY